VDDDVRYRRDFLESLLNAQRQDHSSSFSYYTYRTEGVTVGQGCDGFSFWYPTLAGIRQFAETHITDAGLFYHDDLWISFYLASKGISIKSLAHRLKSGLIYEVEIEHQPSSLSQLGGHLARQRLNKSCPKYLLRNAPMPGRRKLAIRLIATYDKLVSSQLRRLNRILRRLYARSMS
jgi:hypothetical protein